MTLELEKREISRVFDQIASTYDRTNHILSFGIDKLWRKRLLRELPRKINTLLDLATGTGDQIFSIFDKYPKIGKAYGVDLSSHMLAIGKDKLKKKKYEQKVSFIEEDAQNLSLEDESVDCVTISFGMRNMPDPTKCLDEMWRVLKPGGKALILEFSLPKSAPIRRAHLFYLRNILPKIGRLVSKHHRAYTYLNETIEAFPYGEAFCSLLKKSKFDSILSFPLTFGIATLYSAKKGS